MTPEERFYSEGSRWQAVLQRDPQAEGAFVYAVSTTGIYCRPTCTSRRPRRENVQFFDDWQLAEAAGYRACKRCAPNAARTPDPALEAVKQACKLIEGADKAPSLSQLAEAVGFSPYHFQRLFKKTLGVTPKQYAKAVRLKRLRSSLQGEASVTKAIYAAGYESSSRFYEGASGALGMKPSDYQNGAEGILIRYAVVPSYLGWVLVAVTGRGICRIDFGDDPEILEMRLAANFPRAEIQADDPVITSIIAQTIAFLEAPGKGLELPLDIQGTAFQQRVWSALQQIQPGTTASYAEIAAQIGNPKAARAVAQACAANKLAVAIPCHRVVRGDGGLGGYRWGTQRKRALLDREASQACGGKEASAG